MRKILFFMISLFSVSAYALPSGNPVDPALYCNGFLVDCAPNINFCDNGCFSLRFGYYGDYVFNRHLKVDSSSLPRTIRKTEMYTNAGEIVLNLWNRLDIFGTLGATQIHLATPARAFLSSNGANDDYNIFTESDFSYSVGARAFLWECGCFSVGASGQYFATRPNINSIYASFSSQFSSYPNVDFDYSEWQINLGLAYRTCFACGLEAIPYANILGSFVHVDLQNAFVPILGTVDATYNSTLQDLKSQRHFGFALGLSILSYNRMSLGIEARFVDEKALCFNAQFRL